MSRIVCEPRHHPRPLSKCTDNDSRAEHNFKCHRRSSLDGDVLLASCEASQASVRNGSAILLHSKFWIFKSSESNGVRHEKKARRRSSFSVLQSSVMHCLAVVL